MALDTHPLVARSVDGGRRPGGSSFVRDPLSWLSLAVAVAAVGGLAQLFVGLAARESAPPPTPFGVRLGMTAAEVRAAYDEARGPGPWRSFEEGDLHVLVRAGEGATERARFELHGGVLVAARVVVGPTDPLASGAALDVAPGWVLRRADPNSPPSGEVAITLISRDCPAHAEEVEQLLGGH